MTQYEIEKCLFKSYSNGSFKVQISATDMLNIEATAAIMELQGLGPIDCAFDDSAEYILTVTAPTMTENESTYYLFESPISLTVYLYECTESEFCSWKVGFIPNSICYNLD